MTDVLYAAKGGSLTTSDLYTVDPATATTTSVGATGHAITGLAFDPTNGTLYAATSPNSSSHPKSLLTIDPATAAATLVGAFTSAHVVPDICFNSTGQLYGWDNTTHRLVLIDKATGTLTQTAAAAYFASNGNGLDFNSTDVLYGCLDGSNGDLYGINATTGARSDLGPLSDSGLPAHNTVSGASFRRSDDVFFGVVISTPSLLATIDVATQVVSLAGTFTGGHWDALAWTAPAAGSPTGEQPEGVSISFTDTTLEPAPTWVRLDI